MIPYTQTILGEEGNCFETCIASLLEVVLPEDVPNFGKDEHAWFKNAKNFVRQFGYDLLAAHVNAGLIEFNCPLSEDTLYIAGGTSHRGIKHAVIYKGSKMIHDPYPERAGLIDIDCMFVLVPIDPSNFNQIKS